MVILFKAYHIGACSILCNKLLGPSMFEMDGAKGKKS